MNDQLGPRTGPPAGPGPDPAAPPPAAASALPEDPDDFRVLAVAAIQPGDTPLNATARQLAGFPVFISKAAVRNILAHSQVGRQTNSEVAGALVGRPGRDSLSGTLYTYIEAAPPVHGYADEFEVTIPPEEWSQMLHQVYDERHFGPDLHVVGWYHSHTGSPAFLSPVDQRTQRQFFSEVWNIAVVVSPEFAEIKAFHGADGEECALFFDPQGRDGTLEVVSYEVISDGLASTAFESGWIQLPLAAVGPAAATPGLYAAPMDLDDPRFLINAYGTPRHASARPGLLALLVVLVVGATSGLTLLALLEAASGSNRDAVLMLTLVILILLGALLLFAATWLGRR